MYQWEQEEIPVSTHTASINRKVKHISLQMKFGHVLLKRINFVYDYTVYIVRYRSSVIINEWNVKMHSDTRADTERFATNSLGSLILGLRKFDLCKELPILRYRRYSYNIYDGLSTGYSDCLKQY